MQIHKRFRHMQNNEQKISPIKQRILKFAEQQGISKREFYKRISVSRGTLESKTGITEDVMAKFIATYPEVSAEWLLTGNGEMIRSNSTQLAGIEIANKFKLRTDNDIELQKIPLYDIEATAGIVSLFTDTFKQEPESYLSIPDIPPCDGAIRVAGNSMYPIIRTGDIILFKQIHNIETSIIWGEMYLVAFSIEGDEYLMIKYIKRGSRNDTVILDSENPAYDPKEIPLACIRALAIVKASVRYNMMR